LLQHLDDLKVGGELVNQCFYHLYSLIDLLSISNTKGVDMELIIIIQNMSYQHINCSNIVKVALMVTLYTNIWMKLYKIVTF